MPGLPINAILTAAKARYDAAGISAPLVDHADADRAYPFVIQGAYTETNEQDTKTTWEHAVTLTFHVYSSALGMKEANDIADELVAAFVDGAALISTAELEVDVGQRVQVVAEDEIDGRDRPVKHVAVQIEFRASEGS